jgi:hypothetical protein
MAALAGSQHLPPLNANNLSALKGLTARDLEAMGFGRPQPPLPIRTPKPDPRPNTNPNPATGQRRVVENLDKAAGEVVELQDLQRAMEMNLDQWDSRDWQGHRPAHTGNSAQYPSSHAVLPPGDRNKSKPQDDYDQLQQLAAMGYNISQNGTYQSNSSVQRPGNPIPPTPFSSTTPNGQQFPRMLHNGEQWLPVPNTDGYPPSYGELLTLYEHHNPGKQPSMRDILMMQLAALASEPENIEGSVFSKSEAPFPPVGFNPFIQTQQRATDSARSSPRDPPHELDKVLRRVGNINGQPARRPAASSVFGGDDQTEVSRMAPSTATEGAGEDDGETTEEDTRAKDPAPGLGLNFNNASTDTLSMNSIPPSTTTTTENHGALVDLFSNMLKSRAASVAPMAYNPPPMHHLSATTNDTWVEEGDSDEDLEADLEGWGEEEGTRLHPRFIRDEAKRRRKWEIKFAELVKAVSVTTDIFSL